MNLTVLVLVIAVVDGAAARPRRLLPRASGRPAGRAAAAALCVGPALPHHAARGCTCRASEQARLLRGRQASMARTRDSRDLAISRSTPPSAAASPPPPSPSPSPSSPPPSPPPSPSSPPSPASRLPVKRAVAEQLSGQTGHTDGRLASWHAGKYQAQALSAARPDAHRTARVAGGVRASAAGVGTA